MYHRIVVGTDGSSTAGRALDVAGELASVMAASIYVVAAYKPARVAALAGRGAGQPSFGEEERLEAKAILDEATDRFVPGSLSVTPISRIGDAADVLLAVAEEVEADLLVIGNRGSAGVRRYLLGGVADRVAHHAPCSVHIVRVC